MTIPGDSATEPAAPTGDAPAQPAVSAPALPPYAYSAASSPYQSPAQPYGAPGAAPHGAPHAYHAPAPAAGGYQAAAYAPPSGWSTPGAAPQPAEWPTPQWPTGRPAAPWAVGGPPAPPRSKTLARVALGLAIAGAVLAVLPVASILSGPFLLSAFIVAIVALASKKQGSKGVAASALVLSVVAWVASIVIAIASWFSVPSYDDPSVTSPEYEVPYESVGDEVPLVESDFGTVSFDESSTWFVAIMDTPATLVGTSYLMIEIEALDASGAVIDHTSAYVVQPVGRLAFEGVFYDIDGDIASLTVRASGSGDTAASAPAGEYEIGPLTATAESYLTTVTGTIGSTFSEEQRYVRVVVLARGPDGAIIAADTSYVDVLPAGGEAALEAQFYEELPADTSYEAYASR